VIEALLATLILALLLIAAYATLTGYSSPCIQVSSITPLHGSLGEVEISVRNTCNKPVRINSVTVLSSRGGVVSYKRLGYDLEPGEAARILVKIPVAAGVSRTEVRIRYSVGGETAQREVTTTIG